MNAEATAAAYLEEAIEFVRPHRMFEEGVDPFTLLSMSAKKQTAAFEVILDSHGWNRPSAQAHLLNCFVEDVVPKMLTPEGEERLREMLEGGALLTAVRSFGEVAEMPEEYASLAFEAIVAPFTSLSQYKL